MLYQDLTILFMLDVWSPEIFVMTISLWLLTLSFGATSFVLRTIHVPPLFFIKPTNFELKW